MTPYERLQPGEHLSILCAPTEMDRAAFEARKAGLEVRDCLCIHTPSGSLTGLLVRAPFENTVVEQVVRYGRGVVAIDGSRIGTGGGTQYVSGGDGSKNAFGNGLNSTTDVKVPGLGRFPTNLLFVHGPSCVCSGTKTVTGRSDTSAPNLPGEGGQFGIDIYGDSKGRTKVTPRGYGAEEVPEWDCQPDCPVYLLDQQSGINTNTRHMSYKREGSGFINDIKSTPDKSWWVQETGGASRFFHQAISLDDLNTYLVQLAGQVINP